MKVSQINICHVTLMIFHTILLTFIWLMLIVSFLFRYYHLHRNHIWQLILDYHYQGVNLIRGWGVWLSRHTVTDLVQTSTLIVLIVLKEQVLAQLTSLLTLVIFCSSSSMVLFKDSVLKVKVRYFCMTMILEITGVILQITKTLMLPK